MKLFRFHDPHPDVDPIDSGWGISLLPALCLVLTVISWFLFRLTVISYALGPACVPLQEFWFPFRAGSWPLSGLFFLIFLLLIALHVVVLFSPGSRRRADKFLLAAGILVLLIAMTPLRALTDSAETAYHREDPAYGNWLVREPDLSSWWRAQRDVCESAQPFIGYWKVVERHTPWWGFQFPANQIEFERGFTYRASTYSWQQPYEGRWQPPQFGTLDFRRGALEGYWAFEFAENRLTLTTPEWADGLPETTIVLERMTDAEVETFNRFLK